MHDFPNALPNDVNGAVGPCEYIQAANFSRFEIFDKRGNSLAGPFNFSSLWPSNAWCAHDPSDAIVKYDRLADQWLLTTLGLGNPANPPPGHQCIAISRTADPVTGGWYLYDFPVPLVGFLDYPKVGVWPDAYYMGTNYGDAWAFDRAKMLTGSGATFVHFSSPGFMLPSDLDGATPPPAGAPNVFLNFYPGHLRVWNFHVDFSPAAGSTFLPQVPDLSTAPFKWYMCGNTFNPPCLPQPGTDVKLDVLLAFPMYRLAYRNFGDHEALVVNHTVDAGQPGTEVAGIRWYELRKKPLSLAWYIFQEGTYSPDATHRWMGSIAMDGAGNIALGYSVSSSTVYPGVRYAGRFANDLLGTMPRGEVTAFTGFLSQTGGSRWDDYTAIVVDPVDDSTFWYTNSYIDRPGAVATRIVAFRFRP